MFFIYLFVQFACVVLGTGKTYELGVLAKDKGSPPLTSTVASVRIDTIEADEVMVEIELEISLEEFEARREQFEEELSKYLDADVSIADYTVLGEAAARRRKRETKKR